MFQHKHRFGKEKRGEERKQRVARDGREREKMQSQK